MDRTVPGPGWTSESERIVSPEETLREGRLHETDAAIGADAERRHGVDLTIGPPAIVRHPRSVVRILASTPLGDVGIRILHRGERDVWRIARAVRPTPIASGDLEVARSPVSPTEGDRTLAETRAQHLVLLRGGATLAPGALTRIRDGILTAHGAAILYGDVRSPRGRISRAPAFSPLRLREEDYLGPVVVLDVAAVRALGGFRDGSGAAALYDLALRAPAGTVAKIPGVLGVGEPFDLPSGRAELETAEAVRSFLASSGDKATVKSSAGRRRVDYAVTGSPLVSIIIPTRGSRGEVGGSTRTFAVEAVRGIVERTRWPHYEIVLVADDATPQKVIDEITELAGERLVLVRWSEPFDFSAKIDRGAVVARGEFLLLLNDDVDVITDDWMDLLLGLAQRDGVGAVSGALYFEDGAVQHLGHHYRRGGAGHIAFGLRPGPRHPLPELTVTREVSGVTAALTLVSARTFTAVGGLSRLFPGNYNDVDFSMKLRRAGLSAIVVGRAALYHFESQTRDPRIGRPEIAALHRRWGALLRNDPFDPA